MRHFVPVLMIVGAALPARAQAPPRVPLREGLTIVTALYEPGRGDYESIKVILRANGSDVRLRYSGEGPAPREDANPLAALLGASTKRPAPGASTATQHVSATRTIPRQDLKGAHEYQWVFYNDDAETHAASTAVGFSAAMLQELKTAGRTRLDMALGGAAGGMARLAGGLLGSSSRDLKAATLQSGTLSRLDTVPFKVLVNDRLRELPAVHARGRLGDEDAEFWVLDDPDNPLALKWSVGQSRLQVVKLSFPDAPAAAPAAARLEQDLRDAGRAVVYGIYFDFASDRIKEESEPVLKEIARVLAANPEWTLSVEGHTDSIGGATANLDLSRRRAAAVKDALSGRFRVAAARLSPAGFGASRPKDSNETLEGRARNRRVELVRQPTRQAGGVK